MSDISIAPTPGRAGFFGWRVTGAAFTIAVFAWGIGFYGPPIFLQTLHGTHGWPVALVSAAITTHFLLGAAVVANLAALHRRFGIVAVTRAGGLLTALGLLGWAFAREPWQLFAATLLSGAGWAMTGGAALNAMIAPWFIRRRPAALAMAFNGASIGGVVFSPLWVVLIAGFGFPLAALAVALAAVLTLWVLAGRYLGRDPTAMGQTPDGDDLAATAAGSPALSAAPLAKPWRERRFATLAAAATCGLFAQIGLLSQLFSVLVPPLGAPGAGLVMGAVTGLAVGGRTLLGLTLRPGADRRRVAIANAVLQASGSLVLLSAGPSVPLLLLGCGLFGLGLGNTSSLPPLIVQGEFAPADVARAVALVTAVSQAGYAFAPAAFGLLRELGAGSGILLFLAAALIQFLGAGALLLGRPR
ncbi:MFS transporter [Plastoroseomonas hellenica]|uniref:MFS transporter n=1 Tax=Plastoroseomonas hellenica TaxID=2687306 RepID=UPI001BAA31C9|nr:MFS transporter [Plastoroseomonas hellenica]